MISVIIPLYNVENYIVYCLNSFENQMYKNFELIIVNDGSTDNSVFIVKEYMSKSDMKIKLKNQENAGVSVARNKGLDEAAGEYICFVDSDDMVGPEYLSQMIEIINNNGCDLVICGIKSVPEDFSINTYIYEKHPVEIMNSYEALKKFLYHDIVSSICSLLIKRDTIEKNQLRFAEGYRYSEDQEVVFKMIAHSKTIAYTRDQLYLYRIRNDSAMSLVDDKRMDGFKLMKGLEKYLQRVRPDFSKEYKRYGTARWVWATLWQIALASDSYKSFSMTSKKYESKEHMKKLVTFPKLYVLSSSLLYCMSPFFYYFIVRKIAANRINNRTFATEK